MPSISFSANVSEILRKVVEENQTSGSQKLLKGCFRSSPNEWEDSTNVLSKVSIYMRHRQQVVSTSISRNARAKDTLTKGWRNK